MMLGVYFIVALANGVLTARIRAREKAVRARGADVCPLRLNKRPLLSAFAGRGDPGGGFEHQKIF